ncbi:MAG TPA: sigma-54 dependent transcriptional regulator [Sphingobacteriaceae bacterium]
MEKRGTVLVVDDDQDILLSAKLLLKKTFSQIITCNSPKELNSLLSRNEIDVILLDMNYQKGADNGREGLYWLEHILSVNPDHVVILMTAYGHVELAVNALKKGATDFILKPWDNQKLTATLSTAYQLNLSKKEVKKLEKTQASLQHDIRRPFSQIIGDSPSLAQVLKLVDKVAPTDANVLILGENGTGKQVIAHEIHQRSSRKDHIFMHVDLGALHANLFESELFGHAKGAFTGASDNKPGRFELAEGGTIFLDEIGNLDLKLQSKLLSVLQEQMVSRVGETRSRLINVRVIAATNMPLHDMVRTQQFRQDLLYRLNTVEIMLPPLRSRGDDVLLLARHFLNVFTQKYHKPVRSIARSAESLLLSYPWPGNIRELQHVIERAVILSETTELTSADLNLNAGKLTSQFSTDSLDLEQMEAALVQKALEKHKGNISKAAQDLGLTRAALYRRMEKFNI